jgi:hypothetical protein
MKNGHWKEKVLSQERADFLVELKAIHAALDIAIFEAPSNSEFHAAEFSAAAAKAGMGIFQQRILERYRFLGVNYLTRQCFQIELTGEPTGKKISWEDLLGPFFDLETGEIRPKSDFSAPVEQWFLRNGLEEGDQCTYGLVDALLDPPYGIRVTDTDGSTKKQLVHRFLKLVLGYDAVVGSFESLPLIFSWSTDWSNYFEAGKEWWGAFYWTILLEDKQEIIIIGASATD